MSSQETEPDDNGQDEPEAMPVFPDRGPNREKMVSTYLPEGDDWPAKTILELNDPHAVSALSQFGEIFPEVDDLQKPIDEFLHMFLKSRTSVSGKSRDEYQRIFESMYGGNSDENAASAFVSMLDGSQGDD